jgi:hypothetical protein
MSLLSGFSEERKHKKVRLQKDKHKTHHAILYKFLKQNYLSWKSMLGNLINKEKFFRPIENKNNCILLITGLAKILKHREKYTALKSFRSFHSA